MKNVKNRIKKGIENTDNGNLKSHKEDTAKVISSTTASIKDKDEAVKNLVNLPDIGVKEASETLNKAIDKEKGK